MPVEAAILLVMKKLIARTMMWAFGAVCLNAASAAASSDSTGSSTPVTVIELFTSEGCSSCPPAEAKLGQLVDDEGVIALSYHVDYWDNIGWEDPFASPRNTERQRRYAQYLENVLSTHRK